MWSKTGQFSLPKVRSEESVHARAYILTSSLEASALNSRKLAFNQFNGILPPIKFFGTRPRLSRHKVVKEPEAIPDITSLSTGSPRCIETSSSVIVHSPHGRWNVWIYGLHRSTKAEIRGITRPLHRAIPHVSDTQAGGFLAQVIASPLGLCHGRIANRFEDISCSTAPPIVGLALSGLQRDKTVTTDDVLESAPLDGHLLRYKWYRIQSDRKVAVCSVHPSEQSTLQCLGCVKTKIDAAKSYHCSPQCFSDAWKHHRVLHDCAASAGNENGNEEEEIFGRFNSTGSGDISVILTNSSTTNLKNGSTPLYPASFTQRSDGETWFEVGRSKIYTPTTYDIGHVLKFECVVIDAASKLPVGHPNTISTSYVIPAPSPSPRHLIPVGGGDMMTQLDSDDRISSSGTFTVLSYNILSDSYTSRELYSYCPSWALSWAYRRQNLLREIVGYRADIVCVQEVILLYCLTIFVLSELPI
ncbi:Carbon catabolite repressor protein 4-like protein 2 [Hibiscus syriacus]|uniref:Carbon catabolite repressor protein 4-like protein 2 n=1 Tax=Hibiscus syriacus TaxID=106335 RepID=A0A6A3A0J7_HIBSY|nr:Carbon catabolite repressor protein 4-like protein 2 [Hibiscus syriacus]